MNKDRKWFLPCYVNRFLEQAIDIEHWIVSLNPGQMDESQQKDACLTQQHDLKCLILLAQFGCANLEEDRWCAEIWISECLFYPMMESPTKVLSYLWDFAIWDPSTYGGFPAFAIICMLCYASSFTFTFNFAHCSWHDKRFPSCVPVSGADRLRFLHNQSTADIQSLLAGQVHPNLLSPAAKNTL